MKKLFALVLAVLMGVMLLSGCSSQSKEVKTDTVTTSSADKTNTESGDNATKPNTVTSSSADNTNTESGDNTTKLNPVTSSSADKTNTESGDNTTKPKTVTSSSADKTNTESGDNKTKPKTVTSSSADKTNTESEDNTSGNLPDLGLGFGRNSDNAFTIHLDNNNTAAEIARYVGKTNWNLPIYPFNGFENYEVLQYYDIPKSYTITSDPKTVTSEKAGEVYYSAPNRIILFYQDAKVEGKFTKVGYLENTDGLKEAVEKNPVEEAYGIKIVSVSLAK
jgi:outer membrane murein-binding lipoprotein Lpp